MASKQIITRVETNEVPILDLQELIVKPAERLKLGRMIETYEGYGSEISQYKRLQKPLNKQIKERLIDHQITACMHGDIKTLYWESPRVTVKMDLFKEYLLDQGVDPEVLAEAEKVATKSTPVYTLKVSRLGVEEEEE